MAKKVTKKIDFWAGLTLTAVLAGGWGASAQTADQAWLRYSGAHSAKGVPLSVRALGQGALEQSAAKELERGLKGLTGKAAAGAADGETVLGTVKEVQQAFPELKAPAIGPEGYWIDRAQSHGHPLLVVAGGDERGALYGAFSVLRRVAADEDLSKLNASEAPAQSIRWVDEWDNIDGSIERGYAGRSIFFDGGKVRDDLAPVTEYAKLLASVGVNGCNVNNVNNAAPFVTPEMIHELARIADAMRPYGVRIAISVDIASPQKIGGLSTFDPLDPGVKAWWTSKINEIYAAIPDFGGFTVKADSEGQPGPASYGRTPADAANLLAGALQPHGGVVLYRGFVYNHHLDWHDPKADRARAAYDIFHPLDGKFAANVVVQTKEGPIDFQAREPVSPLFAGLQHTSQAMELQITQEYTGQQRHLVYLAPMWKMVLDFDLRANDGHTPVKEILEGKSFHQPLGGMVGVAGIGREWLGSPLAMANLYSFGRLAWNPELPPDGIAAEWVKQTVNNDPAVVKTMVAMLMQSWPAYEHYTGPLGLQTLTDITGSHYGPNIESSEHNGWGQWHDADHLGAGKDRTVATGSGYAGQYPPILAKRHEDPATTPDDLLLFFHHMPYTYKLHSGKTVIQYIYDSHYQGAEEAANLGKEWATLKGHVPDALFDDVSARLEYQAGHAIVWRDAIVQYFYKLSGIADDKGRAGNFPGRYEAEDAKLTGYEPVDINPWEDASRGKAVTCSQASCSAEWTYTGAAGRSDIAVQYFDMQPGTAQFTLSINGKTAATWAAEGKYPSRRLHGDNSTRHTVRGVELKPGDVVKVDGVPNGNDAAALDYVEVTAAH